MKRELAVGDSSARFGRFTGAVWVIHWRGLGPAVGMNFSGAVWVVRSLSLSLARSVSLSHSLSLAHSLPLTLSLSLAGKLPPRPCSAYISAANFPQGRRWTPKLDQREKKKKFAGFRPDLAGIRRGITGITVD
jgi:hypothetical protein